MISKKDLLVAILCTFCLTMVLFSAMPVKSAGVYDPWVDANHDGRINVLDLIMMSKMVPLLGTSGTPTLNVTVSNWPNSTEHVAFTQQQVNYPLTVDSGLRSANGYSHLNVLVRAAGYQGTENVTITVLGTLFYDASNYWSIRAYRVALNSSLYETAFSIPVPSEKFSFEAFTSSSATHYVWISYYLTN